MTDRISRSIVWCFASLIESRDESRFGKNHRLIQVKNHAVPKIQSKPRSFSSCSGTPLSLLKPRLCSQSRSQESSEEDQKMLDLHPSRRLATALPADNRLPGSQTERRPLPLLPHKISAKAPVGKSTTRRLSEASADLSPEDWGGSTALALGCGCAPNEGGRQEALGAGGLDVGRLMLLLSRVALTSSWPIPPPRLHTNFEINFEMQEEKIPPSKKDRQRTMAHTHTRARGKMKIHM